MLQSVEHRKQNEVWGYRKQILLRETKKKQLYIYGRLQWKNQVCRESGEEVLG